MPTIKIKGSSTAAAEPLTLAERELAVNVTDKKLYVGDGAAVQKIVGSLGNQEASAVAITGGSIAGITDLAVADGGTGASTAADARTNLGITATGADTTYAFRSNNLSDLASASTARTNLGLGSIATQASSSVSITGGSITGVTDIAIADGGTGASTAADARTNLGLGSIATQSASSVSITGGTISGITDLAVADGGTGASTAADARTNLSVPSTTGSGASGTWDISITGTAANATSATSATTATNLAGGAANRVPYQSASGTTTFVAAPTVTNSYLKWNGTALGWDTVSGGGGGSGDVVGPASATDNQIVLFDSTTGKLIKAATTTGLLKASTGVIAAAVSGTDYAPATSGSAILKGNGSGGFSNAAAGTDYAAATTGTSSQLLGSNGSGGFSNVTVGSGLSYSSGTLSATGGSGTPGGSNTQVQFNDGGSFGGDAGLTYDKTTDVLTVAGSFNGPHNGTVGATTANTGAFTTLSATGNVTLSGGTANGVLYLNGSKVATSGSALTFNGTALGVGTSTTNTNYLAVGGAVSVSNNYGTALLSVASNSYTGVTLASHENTSGANGTYLGLMRSRGTQASPTNLLSGDLIGSISGQVFNTAGAFPYRASCAVDLVADGNQASGDLPGRIVFSTVPAGGITLTERMRLDSSGNLGLGVTPSGWALSGMPALQIKNASLAGYLNRSYLSANTYHNGTNWTYVASDTAAQYRQENGQHQWLTAASGTAGNAITFTQAMTLNASGNLGVGTTSPTDSTSFGRAIDIASGTGASVFVRNTADSTYYGYLGMYSTSLFVYNNASGPIQFGTGNTERARITSGGDLLVGTTDAGATTGVGVKTVVSATIPAIFTVFNTAGGGNAYNFYNTNATNNGYRFYVKVDGGIANYQANNLNLSDIRKKTDIQPAGSYLDKICAIPVKTFLYKDQSDTARNLGVIAQDVDAVAPELVDRDGFGETPEGESPYLSIYQTDLQYALMKCIQEQQALITSLTARVAALEGTQP